MKNLLLIIDAQNDFVDSEGKLYIPGSERAVKNICRWINMNRERIDDIIASGYVVESVLDVKPTGNARK